MEIDRELIKALSCETRIKILKSLGRRRKTLSELAYELELGFSTVKEHLDKLLGVELIEKIDDGHKWKYYELTQRGKQIVAPKKRLFAILVSSLGLTAIGLYGIVSNFLARKQELLKSTPLLAREVSGIAPSISEAAPIETNLFPFLLCLVAGLILLFVWMKKR
jgi:DNA-binding transcriptional ArsR family regulator